MKQIKINFSGYDTLKNTGNYERHLALFALPPRDFFSNFIFETLLAECSFDAIGEVCSEVSSYVMNSISLYVIDLISPYIILVYRFHFSVYYSLSVWEKYINYTKE